MNAVKFGMKKLPTSSLLSLIIGFSALILFLCSSVRHALFQSTAFDLGIFDHGIYLISQGKPPIVDFIGFHILGDHASGILYVLALLYKLYPSIYWLFAVQGICLALGALPTWYLAIQGGLTTAQAWGMATAYLLYPLIFNLNLFDFHPEVIALPAILGAVLAARREKLWWFVSLIIIILSCKAVLAFTVAAMGLWLLIWEKKRLYGAIALFGGSLWFVLATQLIIPAFSGEEAAAVGRYDFLGDSVLEIAKNLIFKPELVLGKLFNLPNLEYLTYLLLPLIWGLSLRHLAPLIPAAPILFLNLLTDYQPQKDLIHQYSLPILPFMLVAAIDNLSVGGGWIRSRRNIILWSLVGFLALAKFGYFWTRYLDYTDSRLATLEAIARIEDRANILVPARVAPHLTHRPDIEAIDLNSGGIDLDRFEYVMLNRRNPGLYIPVDLIDNLLARLKQSPSFKLDYQRDDVFLFVNDK